MKILMVNSMGKLKVSISHSVSGVSVVETIPHQDHRGAFARFFCEQELSEILGDGKIVQINYSLTRIVGTIRGLHYQNPPFAEIKMVRCLSGSVWDVAVDLREGSPTFLHWHAELLSRKNSRMLVIPEGCAHGFQVLEEGSEMLYLHTSLYENSAEGAVRFDDPLISVPWPLPITDISERDRNHPLLTRDFTGIKL